MRAPVVLQRRAAGECEVVQGDGTIQDTVADGEVTEPHISDHEWRHKMGQFLHIHPGRTGEREETDQAQDGRNKYSGKM